MKYRAVIFDLDDTLVKTHRAKWAHHKAVAKKFYGIDLKNEKLRKHWGKPFDKLIYHLYNNSGTLEEMREVYLSLEQRFPKELQSNSLNVVNSLLDRGIEVGVVTSIDSESANKDLVCLGFPIKRMLVIQGADITDVHKPDPDVFLPIFKKLESRGIDKNKIVYVGDALIDYEASRDAGIDFIAVMTGLDSVAEFRNVGVSKIIGDIGELLNLILN